MELLLLLLFSGVSGTILIGGFVNGLWMGIGRPPPSFVRTGLDGSVSSLLVFCPRCCCCWSLPAAMIVEEELDSFLKVKKTKDATIDILLH